MKIQVLVASLCLCLVGASSWAQESAGNSLKYTVHSDKVVSTIDLGIYGQFLEHIYNSVHGGIWGDQILNGTLELRPARGNRGNRGASQPAAAEAVAPIFWELAGDAASLRNDADAPLNGAVSLRIQKQQAVPVAGVRQKNISLVAGENYKGSIYLKGAGTVRLDFSDAAGAIVSRDFSDLTSAWKKYEFTFTPTRAAESSTLTIGLEGAGTVNVDQVSMFSASALATGGFRPDLLKAITDLKPASIRWPGGSFANTYIWQNGVGPIEKRISHPVEVWGDRDTNHFGTDEFIQLCEKIGAEPILVLNTARGVQENLNWLEYCMGDESTPFGKQRAQNGRREPYKLKTIEIDNETWLLMDKPAYVKIVHDFSPAIRAKYPSLKISICGSYAYDDGPGEGRPANANWDQTMLDEAAKEFDILSPHYYNGLLAQHPPDYVDDPRKYEQQIISIGEKIKKSANPNIKVYVSEWNLTHGRWGNDWRVGLYAGGILNAFERQSNLVTMACPALWLRRSWATAWNNALINHDQSRWFPAGNYVVMKLFRESYAPKLLAVEGPEKPLSLTATKSEDDRMIYLKVVNTDKTPTQVSFEIDGAFAPASASMQIIAPGEETAKNSLENPNVIKVVPHEVKLTGRSASATLPPLSVGVISVAK